MEEIVTCSICAQVFNSFRFIPKILECGHTFCSPCVTKLFRNNPRCPNCRAEIKGTESLLPINYTTLKVVDIYKSKNWSESEMDITAEVTKRKDIILKKEARMALSFEVFDKCLAKLEKLTVSESERIGTVNVKRILNEVDEDLKRTDDVVRCDDLKKSMSFLLSNFEDSKEYLLEIYKRLQNEEKVFAVHKINDYVKYGKIFMCGNQLFFYSLSLSEVPKNSSLIWVS
ncbi:RING finger protein nhl-1 [Armadillidium vulgare]|nr:RING finger protein nhl-1 [Armadillidium vulgare]